MAFDKNTQEQIQRYLDGEMSVGEQQAFEQKIALDEAFAQEIALQKDISSLLADTPENALRKNLRTLSDQYPNTSFSKRSWKNFFWIVPLLLICGIWFFSTSSDKKSEEISNSEPTETLSTPNEASISPAKADTSNIEFITPQEPLEKISPTLDNQKNKVEQAPKKDTDNTKAPVYADKTESPSNNRPIAPPMIMAAPSLLNHDFFAPLPLLDSLIAQNSQSEKFQIIIQQPLPDTLSLEEAQKNNHPFTTTLSLSTSITNSLSDLGLYLYPNHAFFWEKNHPWDFTPAKVNEPSKNTYQIQLTPNLNLESGLYYYALRFSKEGEVFYVGKLVVLE